MLLARGASLRLLTGRRACHCGRYGFGADPLLVPRALAAGVRVRDRAAAVNLRTLLELAPTMHANLKKYVTSVRSILNEPLSPAGRVRRIRTAAKQLIADGLPLSAEERQIPDHGYGRNLLYRDPDHGFVVIAMVWPPGHSGPPHDHGTWGVVAVTEGEIAIDNYVRDDDGSNPEHATLIHASRIAGPAGTVGYVLPPHEDVHRIGNASASETSVSIHTYGMDIKRCNVFDLETGHAEQEDLSYS